MSRIERALQKAVGLRQPVRFQTSASPEGMQQHPPEPDPANGALMLENPSLVTLNAPESPAAEEYRKVKSLVMRLTKKKGFLNRIMVASCLSGEGKSLTSLNLAVTLAQDQNHSVLLVDTDLRRPTLHEYFGVAPGPGLADCLASGRPLEDAIIRTAVHKLSFLPAGSNARKPFELISSSRMADLIHEMKGRYRDRYIIFDTPPLLPYAEANVLSTLVDGVLIVVREGVTPLKSIHEALEVLNGSTILGIVYNDVSVDGLDGRYVYYRHPYGQYQQNG